MPEPHDGTYNAQWPRALSGSGQKFAHCTSSVQFSCSVVSDSLPLIVNKYFEWSLTDILLQHTDRMGHLDWNRPWWFLKSEKLGLYKPPFQISKQFWSFRTEAFNSSWVQSTSANASSSHKRLTVLVCYMCQLPQFIFFFFFVEIF